MLLSPLTDSSDTIPIDYISEDLQINASRGTVLENRDSHGGWLGDGESFVKISFSEADHPIIEKAILFNDSWKPLPLTEDLELCIYGGTIGNHSYAPMFQNDTGDPLLPSIEHGYYFFEDRFKDSADPSDDTNLRFRSTWNFTLAIYDTDTATLYYLLFDT